MARCITHLTCAVTRARFSLGVREHQPHQSGGADSEPECSRFFASRFSSVPHDLDDGRQLAIQSSQRARCVPGPGGMIGGIGARENRTRREPTGQARARNRARAPLTPNRDCRYGKRAPRHARRLAPDRSKGTGATHYAQPLHLTGIADTGSAPRVSAIPVRCRKDKREPT